MRPFYVTSEFWLNLLLAAVGAVASMQGLPGSVTQVAGLAAMALSAILHTTSRTVLKHQDSKEQAAASLAVMIPNAGKLPNAPVVGLATVVKTLVLCVLASSLMSCGGFQASVRAPAAGPVAAQAVVLPTDAQCASWLSQTVELKIAQAVLGACAGGTGISAAFPNTTGGREAFGITAAACGLLDVGATVWLDQDDKSLATYCSVTP